MLLLLPLLLLAAAAPSAVQGFQPPAATLAGARRQPSHSRLAAASSSSSSASTDAPKQATLDSRTPWQLSLTLTRDGFDPVRGELLLRFVQTPNYEPPQVNKLHECWCCVVRIAGVYLGAPTYPDSVPVRREFTKTGIHTNGPTTTGPDFCRAGLAGAGRHGRERLRCVVSIYQPGAGRSPILEQPIHNKPTSTPPYTHKTQPQHQSRTRSRGAGRGVDAVGGQGGPQVGALGPGALRGAQGGFLVGWLWAVG